MRGLALFDCVADDPATELSFKKGDIIFDLGPSEEEGWFLGRVQNTNTSLKLLPESYVKTIIEKPPPILPKPKILAAPISQKIAPQLAEKKSPKFQASEDNSKANAFIAVKDRLSLFENSSQNRVSSKSFSMDVTNDKVNVMLNKSAPKVPVKPVWSSAQQKSASISFDPFEPPPLPSRGLTFDILNTVQEPEPFSRVDVFNPPSLPPKPAPSNSFVSDSSKLSIDLRAIYEKINNESRARYQSLFKKLDPECKGTIDGTIVRSVWLRSRLDLTILANIWDRLDKDCSGSLSDLAFAIGLYLIDCHLAGNNSVF